MVIRSSGPLIATTVSKVSAHLEAISLRSWQRETESTPRTQPFIPVIELISPALPFKTAISSFSRRFITVSVLRRVAPAPTGSRTTGTPFSFADLPASSIESTWGPFSVPIFKTSASAAAAISAASLLSDIITGDAPAEIVMFAQSLTVTMFVI